MTAGIILASCCDGPTYTSYKLFHGHWGAISGCLHVSRIRFIDRVYPAITRIDSLRPAVLFSPCSSLFSSLRAGPSPHAWFIRGKDLVLLIRAHPSSSAV